MKRGAFTLIELLVVIAIIAILMGILMPALSRARELGKRATCLSHLKSMLMSWIMYADDNDDLLVNGDAGEYSGGGAGDQDNPYWVQRDYDPGLTYEQKKEAIEQGALFPYVRNIKSYHCPTGRIAATELRMFCIVDSMNVREWWILGRRENGMDGTVTYKRRSRIKDSARRIVFMDDGGTGGGTKGGWSIYATLWAWWDPLPSRHGNGTTLSFADGHAEYWKWIEKNTIDTGNLERWPGRPYDAGEGNIDNYKLRFGVWGEAATR